MANGKRILFGVFADVLSLVIVFLPTIVFELGNIQPFQRGFFCDDDTIKYPYKDNTVPSWTVAVFGVLIPSITIVITEIIHNRCPYGTAMEQPPGYQLTTSCSVPRSVFNCYKIIGTFLFGLAVTQSITDICKYSLGRLRPHFLDVCKPNISADACDSTKATGIYVYVDNYTCSRPRDYTLDDSRMSFISGHTSISAYCAVFLVLYLQARFTWSGSKLLRHFLQVAAMYVAIYVGLSRISDYKHHWSDVLCAEFLGALLAIITSRHITYMFRRSCYLPVEDSEKVGDISNSVVMLNVDGSDVGPARVLPSGGSARHDHV